MKRWERGRGKKADFGDISGAQAVRRAQRRNPAPLKSLPVRLFATGLVKWLPEAEAHRLVRQKKGEILNVYDYDTT
ncbi:hypothetical protein [Thermogutta sp.]|uniref:hypothetical protein n=1 Tax=Thermogutta sp. TaxID=1962930 RepID=UPI00321FA59C